MRRGIRTALILAAAVLASASCGHKGAIMTPLTRIPKPVEDLAAGQRGGRILLTWKAPGTFIDGRPLPPGAVYEIWLLRNDAAEANLDRSVVAEKLWDKALKLAVLDIFGLPVGTAASAATDETGRLEPKKEFAWDWEMSPEDRDASRLVLAVRVVGGRRSFSDFADTGWWPRKMPVAPGKPRATAFADRVEVRWAAPALNMDGSPQPVIRGYNIYRSGPNEPSALLNTAPVESTNYADRTFEFGIPYVYKVRALTGPLAPYVETDESEGLEFTAVDTFPPPPPGKPTSITAVGLVTLVWEAGSDEMPAGFRVWRRRDDEADFRPLTPEAIDGNTYTDKTIESGHRYEYAVTAVDAAGNESARSESLTEIIREGRP